MYISCNIKTISNLHKIYVLIETNTKGNKQYDEKIDNSKRPSEAF